MTPKEVPDGPLLVDTGTFSIVTWERPRHEEFTALMLDHVLTMSFASIAELRHGALKAGWGLEKRTALELKVQLYLPLTATDTVTAKWADLYLRFRDQIGINDLWIAACALAQPQPLPVITTDLRHFDAIAAVFPLVVVHPDR